MPRRALLRHTFPATAALVAATAAWGSTFIVTKGSLEQLEPASLLAPSVWVERGGQPCTSPA